MYILLHSSKTMRTPKERLAPLGRPAFLSRATELVNVWRGVTSAQLESYMHISRSKADEVAQLYASWSTNENRQIPAIDAFIGDIYSGLQVHTWSLQDRAYAQQHLLILSGLYGGLRACDGVMPYRLEMGYKLPDGCSLYAFWGDAIAKLVPPGTDYILNLSAVEYTKALLPHLDVPVITPKFLTISPKTGQPTFVAVHAKIARGAFARWVIQNKIDNASLLKRFAELGYEYHEATSTTEQPVFICKQFKGLGLSVRLTA